MPDIQVGDLVRWRRPRIKTARRRWHGVWLVIGLGGWKVLCTQGNKRMWFFIESMEKV